MLLYRLAGWCPNCKRIPAIHLPEWLVQAAHAREPDEFALNLQCTRPTCRRVYDLFVVAIQHAEPVVEKAA